MEDIDETAANPINDKMSKDDENTGTNNKSEVLEIKQEATMPIFSDKEADLEAQSICFTDVIIPQNLRGRSSSENSQDCCSSSQVTYEIITKPDSMEENNSKPRISLLLKNSANKSSLDIFNKKNNTQTMLKNKTDVKKLENNKALGDNENKKDQTKKSLANNKTTLSDQKLSENNQNSKILLQIPGQKSHYSSSNNSTCGVGYTLASAGAESESCGNIYVLSMQQKLIFNCQFCDLKYCDLVNFGRHLHEAHELFNVDEYYEKQNDHCNLRKANRNSNNAPKIATTNVKKEPLRCLDFLAEPPVALPPSAEPLHSCGSVFVLNRRKLFLVCEYCECKYANLDLFEKHLKQQHRIFEGCGNDMNAVTKVEVNDAVYVLTEIAESAEIDKEQSTFTETCESEAVKTQVNSVETSVASSTKQEKPELVSKEFNDTKGTRNKKRISSATPVKTPNKRPKRNIRNNAKFQSINSTNYDDKFQKGTSQNTFDVETKDVVDVSEIIGVTTKVKDNKDIPLLQNEIDANDVTNKDARSVSCNSKTKINNKGGSKNLRAVKRLVCNVCPSSFPSRSLLDAHSRLHTGEKPFACDECGKKFRVYSGLKEHQQRHSNERKFKCQICQLGFSTKRDLNLHMRHHINDRRFQCSNCPKSFVRKSDLKIHVRIHTGEKPYVCEICHKCFRANQNLSVHRKSHMGEALRNYKCEYCDKRFLRKIDRKSHMRSHTGEKPFKCEICQRSYSSKFYVRAHIERDHVSANKEDKPLKVKKNSRKKPGAVKDELKMHKKLIDELQNQLLQQIQEDEKIIPTDQKMFQQLTLENSTTTASPSLSTTSKSDPTQSAYELLNKLKSSKTTCKTLTVISPLPPMAELPSQVSETKEVKTLIKTTETEVMKSLKIAETRETRNSRKASLRKNPPPKQIKENRKRTEAKSFRNSDSEKRYKEHEPAEELAKMENEFDQKEDLTSTIKQEEQIQPSFTPPQIELIQVRPLPQGKSVVDGPADVVIIKLKNEIEANDVKNTDVCSATDTIKTELNHKDECDKQFHIHESLKEHKQRHFNDRKFKCEICQLGFSTKRDLKLHMRHHKNDRRFQCPDCPASFVRKSGLKIHIRIHTGEKPFVCEICHKCFRANQNLSAHRKSHLGEASKNYKCEHCDKKFLNKRDCQVHMRKHTREKPFKCEICQRGFSSKFNVRAHMERDHILEDELAMHKKLIEELQSQIWQQVQKDEKIIPFDQELLQQNALPDSSITAISSLSTANKTDPMQLKYDNKS